MSNERVRAYWERVDYSKYVGQNQHSLTVVDFVSPVHLFQYEDMYRGKGFVFDQSSFHNFDANIAKIQAPPLLTDSCDAKFRDNYVGESQRVKSEAPASEAIIISSDSDDGTEESDTCRDFSFDIPPVIVKSEFPNLDGADALNASFNITEPTLVKTEMKNEPPVSSTHTRSRKRRRPAYSEDSSSNNFGQSNAIEFTENGSLVRDYGHGDLNYLSGINSENYPVPDFTTRFSGNNGYTENSHPDNSYQSGSRFSPTQEEQNNTTPFQFQYTRRQSTATATDPNSNFNYRR